MSNSGQSGYRGILRSTVLVGAGSAAGLAMGMVRGKFIAEHLGPAGTNIYGLLSTLLLLLTTLLSCGLAQAGVKAVAGDGSRPARGAATVYQLTPFLAGLALLVTLAGTAVFGRARVFAEVQPRDLYWLAVGVSAAVLGAGWGAILQGRQALKQMTVASVVGGVVCTALALPCLWWWGEAGIVAVVVLGSVTGAAAYWWALPAEIYSTHQRMPDPMAARALARTGLILAGGLILTQATAYLTRVMVTDAAGRASGGWYQAALTLAATMPAFALNAMGASLYPQLVAAPERNAAHALVNRQLQIALLVTGPVLLLISTLAAPLLRLLFAAGFEPAIELLRWIALGTFGRLVVWPLGYLLLARSTSRVFLLVEATAAALLLGFTWVFVMKLGINGSGIAYAVAYGLFSVLLLGLAWRLHRFRLNRLNLEWIAVIGLSLGLIQLIFAIWPRSNPEVCGLMVSLVITVTAGIRIWRLTREGAFLRS